MGLRGAWSVYFDVCVGRKDGQPLHYALPCSLSSRFLGKNDYISCSLPITFLVPSRPSPPVCLSPPAAPDLPSLSSFAPALQSPSPTWYTGAVPTSTNPLAPFDKPFYLIANLAVCGNFVGQPCTPADSTFQIDWIKVWDLFP